MDTKQSCQVYHMQRRQPKPTIQPGTEAEREPEKKLSTEDLKLTLTLKHESAHLIVLPAAA